jgi:photosystem II stability/assembly factor-like uncharacterized protein
MRHVFLSVFIFLLMTAAAQQRQPKAPVPPAKEQVIYPDFNKYLSAARFRTIGPFRGGRSVTATGVIGQPLVYYMGTTGGGVWKTTDAGLTWNNISDGYFTTGSIGAVAVSDSDPNVVYVGAGEHAPRGVMASYGDGVYKSTDAGKTWKKIGLEGTRHISGIAIHPQQPDVVYVAAQGSLYGPSEERGIYRSLDGGKTWAKILYTDQHTGCSDISMDMNNPRILYAAMWDHQRLPWEIRSGGKGSGLYKSVDGGDTWNKLTNGLPDEMGKMGIKVCRSNPEKVYALVESDTRKEAGGLFVSLNGGKNWSRISSDHRLTQRAWYYIEVFADPQNENIVYVLNSPGLRSTDGGKTWTNITGTHGDYHHLWINPNDNKNMVIANDGGASVSFNSGQSWSKQNNQPTAQFYRVNADNLFPYNIYGGQQDNSSVMIANRNPSGFAITEKDWTASAGGESAFIAFNPDQPNTIAGGSYQGTIEMLDRISDEGKPVMVAPIQYQSLQPKEMRYRFNWNAPIICSRYEPNTFFHGGNRVFKTTDKGKNWQVISPDLTRHDTAKMGMSGIPYTNEGAGGENYCTLAYIAESPHEKGVIWTGSDDGLVYLTKDGGANWVNVTPAGLPECLVNAIEISPHDKSTVYIATTRYKWNDLAPGLYKSTDQGRTWTAINSGIPYGAYTRVVREDPVRKDLLFAGTETGLFVSYDGGAHWSRQQMGLPITPVTDLKIHQGDLIAATMGRSYWVFDDMGLLRQLPASISSFMELYKPEDAYRVSGSSILDGARSEDEDDENFIVQSQAGVNPSSGIVFYYQLPEKPDSNSVLSLSIYKESGQLIRTYSSKADASFVKFPGGPQEDPALPVKTGLNRFVWDMRFPTLPGVPTVFIEGSYRGHKVAPGLYKAVLKLNSTEKQTSFQVLPDPRLNYTAEEYTRQDVFLSTVEEDFRAIHLSVLRMRKIRKQLEDRLPLLKEREDWKSLQDQAQELIKKMRSWEDELVQNKAKSNDDIINYVNKLSADYIFLKGEADVNIPYVTKGQEDQYTYLSALWSKHKATMQGLLDTELVALNRACRDKGVDGVIVPK